MASAHVQPAEGQRAVTDQQRARPSAVASLSSTECVGNIDARRAGRRTPRTFIDIDGLDGAVLVYLSVVRGGWPNGAITAVSSLEEYAGERHSKIIGDCSSNTKEARPSTRRGHVKLITCLHQHKLHPVCLWNIENVIHNC